MSNDTYLAVFLGSKTSSKMAAWNALPEAERKKKEQEGIAAYVVVEADSQDAAAAMFENHPHFAIFPGDGVDVMPCLPIPGQG